MDAALRSGLNQHVRPLGFSGSYPHLRRIQEDRIALLTVQFDRYGGRFVVEVGVCGLWGNRLQDPESSTVSGVGRLRARLGSETFPTGDHWFTFGPHAGHNGSTNLQSDSRYRRVAAEAMSFIQGQAEAFWCDTPLAD